MSQKQLNDVDVAAGSSEGQRGVVGHVAVFLVGIPAEQALDDFVATSRAGQGEWGVLGTL